MNYTTRSLEHITSLSARGLMGRYISDVEFAGRLYGTHYSRTEDFSALAQTIDARKYPRSKLAEILRQQNTGWGMTQETGEQIRALEEGALCVITGQQTGLFGGPLYTVYKALTAVAWARDLSAKLARPVVPVFWLAGDDHDLDEINHVVMPGRDGRPVTWRYGASSNPGARVSRQVLDEDIRQWLERFVAALPDGPARNEVADAITSAYRPATSWQNACAELLTRWLGRFGIVFVTPDDGDLKRLMTPVFREEALYPEDSEQALHSFEARIISEGYRPQVVRPDKATLLFIDNESGTRSRIDYSGEKGHITRKGDAPLPPGALRRLFDAHPALFSANALLRPVTGDAVFPTIAHVMGPGETAYMAQARGLYERHKIPMPIVVPRARLSVIPQELTVQLERTGLGLDNAFRSTDSVVGLLASQRMEREFSGEMDSTHRELTAVYERVDALVSGKAPGVRSSVSSAVMKSHKIMNRISGKLEQELRRQIRREYGADITAVTGWLFPDGTPQERVYPALPFLIAYGTGWLDAVLESIDTESGEHIGFFAGE